MHYLKRRSDALIFFVITEVTFLVSDQVISGVSVLSYMCRFFVSFNLFRLIGMVSGASLPSHDYFSLMPDYTLLLLATCLSFGRIFMFCSIYISTILFSLGSLNPSWLFLKIK